MCEERMAQPGCSSPGDLLDEESVAQPPLLSSWLGLPSCPTTSWTLFSLFCSRAGESSRAGLIHSAGQPRKQSKEQERSRFRRRIKLLASGAGEKQVIDLAWAEQEEAVLWGY